MEVTIAVKKIRKFFLTHNRMPSHREICLIFGYATKASSQFLVKKLLQAGIVAKDDRGRLIPKKLFPALPVLGVITAGFPNSAEEQIIDMVSIGRYLIDNPEKSYILRVSGDSMIEAGIHPEDLVIVEKEKEPKNGDVIVAQTDNEFTLKYFHKKGNDISLVPANRKYPVIKPKENLAVFGVVISVVRKYK